MSTQHTPVQPVVSLEELVGNVYTIVISERQRYYLHLALSRFIQHDPGEELDEYGNDIPTTLADMLDPNGSTGPLAPYPCVNGLVL
jgi:hypothetical protein